MTFNVGGIEQTNLSFQTVIKLLDGFRLPSTGFKTEEDILVKPTYVRPQFLELLQGITVQSVFNSVTSEQIQALIKRAKKSNSHYSPTDFFSFYTLNCPVSIDPIKLLQVLTAEKIIEYAYIENIPVFPPSVKVNKSRPRWLSNYLLPAPIGINALYAWNFKGGDGDGKIKFVDVEQGWISNHEKVCINTIPSTGYNHEDFRDHGIAVLGIIMMQTSNDSSGIVPKSNGFVISPWRPNGFFNTADAIMAAVNHLDYGDILLLEMQCFGSTLSSELWPIEIQEAVFQVIQLATALGITVIETAGNGDVKLRIGNNLDQFNVKGKKIFNRDSVDFRDSGAIVVGACSSGPAHNKAYYTNYGNRIDCFAYGECVHTAGNFPKSSGIAVNTYTSQFGGTSAAAAIVAGAAIAVQSISEKYTERRLSPQQLRYLLSSELYNTTSENNEKDKIGVMPDLQKIIDNILNKKTLKASTIQSPKDEPKNIYTT